MKIFTTAFFSIINPKHDSIYDSVTKCYHKFSLLVQPTFISQHTEELKIYFSQAVCNRPKKDDGWEKGQWEDETITCHTTLT